MGILCWSDLTEQAKIATDPLKSEQLRGTRSEQGTESKMTLASIFGTWRAQGLNPLAACRQLLTSPQV